ncbi:DeoR/GlpR transcriptional regulator [Nocardioides sp. ChNu-153]|uniref:DeoR/GlpR family DNA-binding transcription regulator n=1 Tax=Nocardioides sp. ChNu-153 TaxID=2779364 RepID=UPI00264CD550|nr:DeoR/GlpR family DNA-binding transcription regulator [Nocardioides sp. ChNu-153]MDN7120392.1 DeoR/GlpR transcriptional regulator [Nocardioides sp. ChNu-153]
MQQSKRHKTIIHAVAGGDAVTIAALVELTGVSAVTIRRDLAELAAVGAVVRTHGGVRRARQRGVPMPFATRSAADQELKSALAAVAAGLVADEDAVVVDNGTTCLAVAHALAGRSVTALALSLHAAAALAARPGATVVVPGGVVETDTLAFGGASAVEAVHDFRADVAVIGACSASPAQGLTSTTHDDARLKRAVLAGAARRVLVAAPGKLARTSAFRFGDAADLTHLVTSTAAAPDLLDGFRAEGVDVHLVDAAPDDADPAR